MNAFVDLFQESKAIIFCQTKSEVVDLFKILKEK